MPKKAAECGACHLDFTTIKGLIDHCKTREHFFGVFQNNVHNALLSLQIELNRFERPNRLDTDRGKLWAAWLDKNLQEVRTLV